MRYMGRCPLPTLAAPELRPDRENEAGPGTP